MITQNEINQFMNKIKKLEKGEKLDLSSDEDLSIAVMNLISIEEHMFFSAGKTGKTKYYDLLHEIREMRKQLMKQLVKKYEGEGWCISKHLLAASMRLMEVGTKALTKGETNKAYDLFQKSYNLYNLFWGINTDLIKKGDLKKIDFEKKEEPIPLQKNAFFAKISSIVGKVLDCCKE